MDTGTHLIMGVGLAGLAHLDPAVASAPGMNEAILLACILGSQAPDIDTLYRIKGTSFYVRNHRGMSHSLPALFLYALFIPLALSFLFAGANLHSLMLWTSIALFLHVLTDLLNGYGTQAFRPFTERWISWNVLPIFDWVIFSAHLAGMLCIVGGLSPGITFASIYSFLTLYTCWRIWFKRRISHQTMKNLSKEGQLHLFPTLHPLHWDFIYYEGSIVRIGTIRKTEVTWVETLSLADQHNAILEAAKQPRDIQNFLYFSRFPYAEICETDFGYEVRFIDLRYRKKKNFPLLATIYLNKMLKPIDCYVGWKHEQKVHKKLRISLDS